MRLRAQGAAQPLAKPGGYGDLAKEQDSEKFQRGRGGKEGSGIPAVFKKESVEVRSSSLCGGKRNGQRQRHQQRYDHEGFGGHSALGLILGAMRAVHLVRSL